MSHSRYPQRTINWRALGVLVVGSAVLAGILYGVNFVQVKRNMTGLLAQADQAEREGEVGVAADYVWQYLGFDPKNNDVLGRYALLAQKQARIPRQKMRVLALFEQVLRRDSGQIEIRREAAQLAVELGLAKDARTHLEELRKTDPKNEPHLLWARCEARSGEFDTAAVSYARVVAETPGDIAVWREYLATVSEGIKDPATAEGVVSRMLTANPRSAEARQLAVAYHLRAGSADKAEEHLRVAFDQLKGDSEEWFLLAADVARARGQKEQVGRYLRAGVEKHPNAVPLRLELARFEGSAGRSKAIAILQPLRNPLPTRIEQRWELGSLLAELGDTAGAEEVLAQFSGRASDWARSLLTAQLWLRKQEFGKARLLLEKLRTAQMPYPGLARFVDVMLADCYLALQSPEQAATAARRAVTADPGNLLARTRLAQALAASGKSEEATKEIAHAVAQEPSLRLQQARLLLAAQLRKPQLERDWKEVETALAQLPEPDQKQSAVQLLRAEIHAARDEGDVARKLAEAAREQDPKQVEPWLFLAELARRRKGIDEALAVLVEAEQKLGVRIEWVLAQTRYSVLAGGEHGRKRLQALVAESGKWSGEDHDRLLAALAEGLSQTGDTPGAEKLWRQLAQRRSNDVTVRMLLLERAASANKLDEVKQLASEIEQAEGADGAIGCYGQGLAAFLAWRGGEVAAVVEAERQLARAATLRPSWERVPALQGEIKERQGRKPEAVAHYLAAIDLGDVRLTVWHRATQLCLDLRRFSEAEALLRRLPEPTRTAGVFGQLNAALTLATSDEGTDPKARRDKALEMARNVVKSDKGTYRDHIWLSQMAWAAGNRAEAEKAVAQARKLAPDEPATLVAHISLLNQIDRDRARRELAQAEKAFRNRAPVALMVCCELVGQSKEAESYAQSALTGGRAEPGVVAEVALFHARNGRGDESAKLWRTLIADGKAPEEIVRAARRGLALHLALTRKYPVFKEAVALIERNLEKDNTTEDRRIKAMVMTTQPAHRAEAIRLLVGLAPMSPQTPPHLRFQLARLYELDDRWPQARTYLRALVQGEGKSQHYLAFAIRALVRHDEAEEAGPLLEQLAKLDPDGFETVELRSRFLHATGKKAEARRLLLGTVKGKDDWLVPVALTFESLKEDGDAEILFRRVADNPKQPIGMLYLARNLARRKQTAEALRFCDQAEGKLSDDLVARMRVVVLRTGAGTTSQIEAAAEKVSHAQKRSPELVDVRLALAELEEMRGRYDQAVAQYRQVVKADPVNPLALNNLSYFLAMRKSSDEEALKLVERLLEALGPVAEVLDTRGLVHLTAGRHQEAVKDFSAAIRQDPAAVKYFHLTQAQLAAGDLSAARVSWAQAIRKGLKEEAMPPLERPAFKTVVSEVEG